MRKHPFVVIGLAVLAALAICAAPAPAAQAVSFSVHADHATGTDPISVAAGDFNGDDKLDLVSCNSADASVSILAGNGLGGFGAKVDWTIGAHPSVTAVAVGDLNGDGAPDLVTPFSGDSTITVLLNYGDGSGGFHTPGNGPAGASPMGIALADFNGDQKLDLVTADYMDIAAGIMLGDGGGGFGTRADFATLTWPSAVAVGDFNGDGKADLAVTADPTAVVSILLGNGDGTFQTKVDFTTGADPQSIAVTDFNGDGKADLAIADNGGAAVSVLLGDGAGGFGTKADLVTGSAPRSVAVGDLNGDSKADIVTANTGGDTISVLLGDGAGGFAAKADFATGAGSLPTSVAVADLNADTRPDLAVCDSGTNAVSVLLNVTAKPRISSLSPKGGKAGATVTIAGSGFHAKRGAAKVYFGSKAVTRYVSWTAGKIKVKVPKLSKGKKAVTVRTADGKSNVKYFTVR